MSWGDRPEVAVHRFEAGSPAAWTTRLVEVGTSATRVAWTRTAEDAFFVASSDGTLHRVVAPEEGGAWRVHELGHIEAPILDLISADFDDDGLEDLGLAVGPPHQWVAWHGTAEGTWVPTSAIRLTPEPRGRPEFTTADLDADGRLDLLASLPTGRWSDAVPDHLRVFRNHWGIALDEAWYPIPGLHGCATGDIDGDGRLDVAGFGDEGVWVLLALGRGWLSAPTRILTTPSPGGVLVDADGDGRDDVIALDPAHDRLRVVHQLETGRWSPPESLAVGAGPIGLVALGEAYLVTANERSSDFTVLQLPR